MSDTTTELVELLASTFPNLQPTLEEHRDDNFGEILPHVFFGEVTRYMIRLVAGNSTQEKAEVVSILAFLEREFAKGDSELCELISVSFLEHLPRTGELGAQLRLMVGPHLARELASIG